MPLSFALLTVGGGWPLLATETGLQIDTPPAIADARLRQFYEYWLELAAAADGLPSRQDFDPLHLVKLLPNIWLIDIEPTSHRMRMCLAGEAINGIHGRPVGGHYLAEFVAPADLPMIVARCGRALTEPAIYRTTGHVFSAIGHYSAGERLSLPMLGRSGRTDTLLGCTVYDVRPPDRFASTSERDIPYFYPIRAADHRPVEIVGG